MLDEQTAFLKNIPRPIEGESKLELPSELIIHYRELLRTYVIMGSGNLSVELRKLACVLVRAGVSAAHVMEVHLAVLQELVEGLGTRSTRHVMARADLLILEVMTSLGEGYRRDAIALKRDERFEIAGETSPLKRLAACDC